MQLMVLTDFCNDLASFLGQLCKNFETAAIESDDRTKMASTAMFEAEYYEIIAEVHRGNQKGIGDAFEEDRQRSQQFQSMPGPNIMNLTGEEARTLARASHTITLLIKEAMPQRPKGILEQKPVS